ncbi:DUF4440 domain-containing protein [Rhodospirillum rubrum]|uniref:nuclear transport factor 2 family protein n=1 Tax=Rhodospirillum rubrum TaxID=1085 RepID=UPI001904E219|nr:nuclear transport factor 2 family protein [Rhodospirillum rubrum]MBK1663810.1 DUF4440 domain-containing protein [Rhodospirillum rubrum]MBK1675851.1 DUF4440 domain-containing protein [Rhodospirillum rubrum]
MSNALATLASPADDIAFYEERLRAAMLTGDLKVLETLLADDLAFVDHTGCVKTKQTNLDPYRAGLLKLSRLDLSDAVVRPAGEDGRVVVVRAVTAGTYDSEAFTETLRFTRIWRRTQGPSGWKLVAGHCSVIL